jgi:hypothetical protein
MVREAFARLLSGETSYTELGKPIGFTPQGMHTIFANPIYMGWRVYDKKRDMSPGAKRFRAGGRQGDRPKIARNPEEIIRVRVLTPPLVSESEFARAQEIIAAKTLRHWKHRPGTAHNFTYAGFLTCALCESPVYGKNASGLYYICRRRFWHHSGKCAARYMGRDRLELKLDEVLSQRLTDREFLGGVLRGIEAAADESLSRDRMLRMQTEIKRLRAKRTRILDAFFEGLVGKEERDDRLRDVDTRSRMLEEAMLREAPAPRATLASLMVILAPLFEWRFIDRESKRRILAVTVPEIRVADYAVRGVSVIGPSVCGDYVTRTRAASLIATPNPERIWLPLNL